MVHPRVTKFGVCVPMVGSKNPYHYKLDTMKYSFLRPILVSNCFLGKCRVIWDDCVSGDAHMHMIYKAPKLLCERLIEGPVGSV